ncbi:MAG: hypothetical protein ACI9WL_001329 [Rubritalea sp.]
MLLTTPAFGTILSSQELYKTSAGEKYHLENCPCLNTNKTNITLKIYSKHLGFRRI